MRAVEYDLELLLRERLGRDAPLAQAALNARREGGEESRDRLDDAMKDPERPREGHEVPIGIAQSPCSSGQSLRNHREQSIVTRTRNTTVAAIAWMMALTVEDPVGSTRRSKCAIASSPSHPRRGSPP